MKSISRRTLLTSGMAATLGVAAFGLSGCNKITSLVKGKPKTALSAAVPYVIDRVDPLIYASPLAISVGTHIFENLYRKNLKTNEVLPYVAIDDPTWIDELTIEIKIFNDKKFSNGDKLTADDVCKSIEINMKDSLYAAVLNFIDSVAKISDDKIQIKLKKHLSTEFIKSRLSVVRIIKFLKADSDEYEDIVGSGPYVYKDGDGTDGSTVHLDINPYYSGDFEQNKDGVTFSIYADHYERASALWRSNVNVVQDVAPKYWSKVKGERLKLENIESSISASLIFNTNRPPFNDVKVRQAILYAINCEKLATGELEGYAELVTSCLPSSHQNYHQAANIYTYQPDKAKLLLRQAGVGKLNIRIVCVNDRWQNTVVERIQDDLASVGIVCDINYTQMNWYDVYKNTNNSFDIALCEVDLSYLGSDADILLSSMYGNNFISNDFDHWATTSSEKFQQVQDLLDAARTDESKADASWKKILDIVSQEVPAYPILHRKIATSWNDNNISNFTPLPFQGVSFLEVKENK